MTTNRCKEYGFMVIDEADIEAHGPFMLYRKEDTDQNRFHRWNEKIADVGKTRKSIKIFHIFSLRIKKF